MTNNVSVLTCMLIYGWIHSHLCRYGYDTHAHTHEKTCIHRYIYLCINLVVHIVVNYYVTQA
jgi:hypothetical protein